jgi:hypothetical protein
VHEKVEGDARGPDVGLLAQGLAFRVDESARGFALRETRREGERAWV